MTFSIKTLFTLFLILCFCNIGIIADETSTASTTVTSTTTNPTTIASATQNGEAMPTGFMPPPPPLDENGNPKPPPMDKFGNPEKPPKDEFGQMQPPPLDENGNPLPPQFDENGNRIPPGQEVQQTKKSMFIYLIIFTTVVVILILLLLIYVFKYKRSINGKIKRLEQVKDMQSLEASNTRPLTTITPMGYIEDKRDVYSSNSSSLNVKRTPVYTESLSLKSTTSDASLYDDAYNYVNDLDYNTAAGYLSPSQYIINKNLGMKYNKPSVEPLGSAYDGPYHSTPANFGVSKNDLDGLYSKTLEPYDTEDDLISPIRPQSLLYDTSGGLSPINGNATYPNQISSPNSMITVIPSQNSLQRSRNHNASVPNLSKINYDTDLMYSNYNNQIKYGNMSSVQPMTPLSPVSPASQKTVVAGYSQTRMDPRVKRRSHSIDITKSKRNSYIESIGKRSPGLYAPKINGSPMMNNRKSSVISESRSAKSILIDQMVQAMDMEAESDDTLSNYPINNNDKSSSNNKARIINIPAKEQPLQMKKNSITSSNVKVTPVSSSSSINKNNSLLTDTSKTFINSSVSNDDVRIKVSDEEVNTPDKSVSSATSSYKKKKFKKEIPGANDINRDFVTPPPKGNIFSQESDSYYESNNSFNQSIYDEVKVFEVEEDEDLIISSS